PTNGLKYSPVNQLTSQDVNLNGKWDITPSLSLTSITAYRRISGAWSYDSDGSPLGVDGVLDHQQHRQVSQELRLGGTSFADRLTWTVGGFYYNAHDLDVALPVEAASFALFIGTHSEPKNEYYAGYAHGELKITDRLTLIAGARESKEDKVYLFDVFDLPGTGSNYFPGGFLYPARTSSNHFDYRAGLEYQFADGLMGYASVSSGFRGGGFNPRPSTPGTAIAFQPETLTNYEVGVRSEFLDKKVRFNNTAF